MENLTNKLYIRYFVQYVVISAILLLICSRSSPFYPLNNASDANCFFTVGKAMLNKIVLYRDIYEQKGPLLYFLYGCAYFLSNSSFLGVFILEILSLSVFLFFTFKFIRLYINIDLFHLPWITFAGASLVTSHSFVFGGCSVEELCLPIFMYSLYCMVKILRRKYVSQYKLFFIIALNGFLSGCIFWMKFTLVGFYIAWIFIIIFCFAIESDSTDKVKKQFYACKVKCLFIVMSAFLMGICIATLPWVFYFASNNAIRDMLKVYLYNNIFLYSIPSNNILSLMPRILDAFFLGMRNNLIYFVNIVLGFIWVCITRKVTLAEKTALIILFVFTTCGIYIGGKSQAYTPLILGVFVPLGVIAEIDYIELCQSIKRAAQKHQHHKRGNLILRSRIKTICALCVTISLIIFTYFSSYNTYFFCAGKDVMPQFEFAKSMYKLEDNPSLLNYGFMDEGFFTAANIIPNIKFFCTLNILTAEIKDEQNNYLYAGATSFVVTKDSQLDTINFNKYELIANKAFYSKSYHSTFYLYHRCCDD